MSTSTSSSESPEKEIFLENTKTNGNHGADSNEPKLEKKPMFYSQNEAESEEDGFDNQATITGQQRTTSRSISQNENYNILTSLPKYIFETEHTKLKSVDSLLKQTKNENQSYTNFGECEVSEYPIELYEHQQHAIERHMSIRQEQSKQQNNNSNNESSYDTQASVMSDLNKVFYNRIRIDEDPDGADYEDLLHCGELLVKAMIIREKYMVLSQQPFPYTTAKYLNKIFMSDENRRSSILLDQHEHHFFSKDDDEPWVDPQECQIDPFDIEFLPSLKCTFKNINGVIHVLDENFKEPSLNTIIYPELKMFLDDYHLMINLISNGPLKTFCYRRIRYLKSKFELHCMLNEIKELTQQKAVPHRDFYNVRKVDTHVHASSCMNQKHLLRYIKKKLKTNGDMVVVIDKVKGPRKLEEVFNDLNITSFDLSVDKLAMHAHRQTFHRFDKFNAKYNPIGQPILRDIFIKTDNEIEGVFFAEILKEVISDLEDSKYQNAEPRISIYGRKANEWDTLAKWAVKNKMYSPNIMWIIQIPRIYDIFRANNLVLNFNEIINNIFMPLFEVTNDPNSHPELHKFLAHVSGFDSVDDESKPERDVFNINTPLPQDWTTTENPPYVYYIYYMYANIQVLNHFRRERGLNIFNFRPHCGEAGGPNHLIAAYMLADNISHGLVLRKVPVLQYLFYLCQIGIAMSPLSNNSMFLNYIRNPFYDYHQIGLNVSLSTDDPLQFHFTREPLMEEYSIAAQVWKLSSVDMCELARNSVIMSGFPKAVKKFWLGPNYKKEGVNGNDVRKTNIPDIRVTYRYETWIHELNLLVDDLNKQYQQQAN